MEAGQLRHLGTCGEMLSRAVRAVPAVLAVLTSRAETHVSCPSLAAPFTGSCCICTDIVTTTVATWTCATREEI